MRTLICTLALLAPLPALAQKAPDKLPPANPLPYENSAEAELLAPINALLAALEAGDKAALLRVVDADGRVTAARVDAEGKSVKRMSFAQFAERITPQNAFKERIWNPAVEIDADVAMVWAPFDIQAGGKVVSCGTNLFDLARENGAWKIVNVTYSARTTGCEAK